MHRRADVRASRLSAVLSLVLAAGLALSGPAVADIKNATGTNVQDGSNRGTTNQSGTGKSGDAVGGQVIGVVTAAGGSTSVVAANRSDGVDVTTGDATGENDAAAFVGQNTSLCAAE